LEWFDCGLQIGVFQSAIRNPQSNRPQSNDSALLGGKRAPTPFAFPHPPFNIGSMPLSSLPIDDALPAVLAALRDAPAAVLVAPPGAGKTTRVPPAILASNLLSPEHPNLVMLQPRRVAARAAASRIAAEQRWTLGQEVGYHVRFDRKIGPRTRLRVLTEGILTRQLIDDPELNGVGAVLLDEFHERSLHTDLAIALLREVQESLRPDLKLLVMSATLAAEPVAKFLGHAPIVRSEGRMFPIDVRYTPQSMPPAWSIDEIPAAIAQLLADPNDDGGDVLVFLPGMDEIRRTQRRLEAGSGVVFSHVADAPPADRDSSGRTVSSAAAPREPRRGRESVAARISARGLAAAWDDLLILPLHGSLTADEQDLALRRSERRKVILATNIAETSLTIEGVTNVIDTGLARLASYDAQRGLDRLDLSRISRASADQRAGRAGRTAPGRCIRLWSEKEHHALPAFGEPEIRRVDLAGTALTLHAWGVNPRTFGWFEPPSEVALNTAESLLDLLGALERLAGSRPTGSLPASTTSDIQYSQNVGRSPVLDASASTKNAQQSSQPASTNNTQQSSESASTVNMQQSAQSASPSGPPASAGGSEGPAQAGRPRRISALGRRMVNLPMHPRLARLLVGAIDARLPREGAALAALLSEKDILPFEPDRDARRARVIGDSDVLYRLQRLEQGDRSLDHAAVRQVNAARHQFLQSAERQTDGSSSPDAATRTAPHPNLLPKGEGTRLAGGAAGLRGSNDSSSSYAATRTDAGRLSPHPSSFSAEETEPALLKLILLAYPDRVCKRRVSDPAQAVMVGGGGVRIGAESSVAGAEFLVAVDARHDAHSRQQQAMVRIASRVEPSWLEELFPQSVSRQTSAEFDESRGKVVGVRRTMYLDLPLREDVDATVSDEDAARVLAGVIRPRLAALLHDDERLAPLVARLQLMREHLPDHPWPDLESPAGLADSSASTSAKPRAAPADDPRAQTSVSRAPANDPHAPASDSRASANDSRAPRSGSRAPATDPLAPATDPVGFTIDSHEPTHDWLLEALHGVRTLADAQRKLPAAMRNQLVYPLDRLLDQHAPESIEVPTGNRIKIDYKPGQRPVLAVRLQEIFGWLDTPRIANGKVPLLLHLLGPNYRPVQITDDLRSFWSGTYFQVRKDLRVRYPKHSWPEDPLTAKPVAKGRSRK
jgi:HrpA-like RNA helicase